MKAPRHEAILKLVAEEQIQTQDELMSRLREMEYHVTQATVSRDIRDLKLTKILTPEGIYRYVIPTGGENQAFTKINATLMSAITKIDSVGNLVVISTYPGMAQAVAAGVDADRGPDVLGCVGGDDTILVICRTEEAAGGFCDGLRAQKSNS